VKAFQANIFYHVLRFFLVSEFALKIILGFKYCLALPVREAAKSYFFVTWPIRGGGKGLATKKKEIF